jgi:proteic killer suppression protein
MIISFADKETDLIYNQQFSRRLPQDIQKRALIKLLLIDAAATEIDLQNPPGNQFEQLSGNMAGYCSIRINDQWRITFIFDKGNAYEVRDRRLSLRSRLL